MKPSPSARRQVLKLALRHGSIISSARRSDPIGRPAARQIAQALGRQLGVPDRWYPIFAKRFVRTAIRRRP